MFIWTVRSAEQQEETSTQSDLYGILTFSKFKILCPFSNVYFVQNKQSPRPCVTFPKVGCSHVNGETHNVVPPLVQSNL